MHGKNEEKQFSPHYAVLKLPRLVPRVLGTREIFGKALDFSNFTTYLIHSELEWDFCVGFSWGVKNYSHI